MLPCGLGTKIQQLSKGKIKNVRHELFRHGTNGILQFLSLQSLLECGAKNRSYFITTPEMELYAIRVGQIVLHPLLTVLSLYLAGDSIFIFDRSEHRSSVTRVPLRPDATLAHSAHPQLYS